MRVGLALGSNVGDRLRQLRQARSYLRGLAQPARLRCSPLYATRPVDCPPGSGPFYNAVVEIDYAGAPRTLLGLILAYERAQGRDRSGGRNAPRTIDIDILYFGDWAIREADFVVPHPRLAARRFVLAPLAALRPELMVPGQRRAVAELLTALPVGAGAVRCVRRRW